MNSVMRQSDCPIPLVVDREETENEFPRLLVTLCTYNERKNLQQLIPEIQQLLPAADLLVIDDNSPDGTGPFVEELAARTRGFTSFGVPVNSASVPRRLPDFSTALRMAMTYSSIWTLISRTRLDSFR